MIHSRRVLLSAFLYYENYEEILLSCFLCLSASFGFNMAQTCGKGIKVLQLNLWGGTSKVSDGYQGFLDLLEEVDPDIVFLCEISGGQKFVHRVIQDMKQRGKLYYGEAFDLAVGFLSKIHPEKVQKLCTVPGNEERTMVKFLVAAGGKEVAFLLLSFGS